MNQDSSRKIFLTKFLGLLTVFGMASKLLGSSVSSAVGASQGSKPRLRPETRAVARRELRG